jgi:predicted nucleic acid-binding protein
MRVAVKDANVLIDLVDADLLASWFRLGIETHTTDLVRHEVADPAQRQVVDRFVSAGLLHVEPLSARQLADVSDTARRLKLSLADASALALAKELRATLLSGDRALRRVAAAEKVDVRGVLWVFDKLVARGELATATAAARLRGLQRKGNFLPADECAGRLARWEGTR